jgi:hypothetical protein
MLRSHRKEDNSQSSFRHIVEISRVKGTCSGGVLPFSVNILEVAVFVDMSLECIFLSFEPELKASMLFRFAFAILLILSFSVKHQALAVLAFDEAGRR